MGEILGARGGVRVENQRLKGKKQNYKVKIKKRLSRRLAPKGQAPRNDGLWIPAFAGMTKWFLRRGRRALGPRWDLWAKARRGCKMIDICLCAG
jgi:hypothetical protein